MKQSSLGEAVQRFPSARRVLVAGCALALTLGAWACATAARPEAPQVRLVVAVAVDQLRADLLDRYDDLFTAGLRRLRDQGYRFTGANHRHAITATAPGHTALATGVVPARSGVVSNSWSERNADGQWRGVYAVQDSLATILGWPDSPGRSPVNLLRDGLADWIQDADEQSVVVSVSRKDRAAITMAARADGHVYWMLPEVPAFTTSTYYRDELPEWVRDFNAEELPAIIADTVWEGDRSRQAKHRARGDTASYEGDGVHTYFPHRYGLESDGGELSVADWAANTPLPDRATLALTERAVAELELGRDEHLDYLAVSFSQTDLVGHGFGPLSREQLDNLLHLDQVLGELFEMLDARVGRGRWVMGFSADHGVLTMPEYLAEQGEYATRLPEADLAVMREIYSGAGSRSDDEERARWVAEQVQGLESVADAFTYAELAREEPGDSFAVLYRNSYYPGRVAGSFGRLGVEARFRPNVLATTSSTGTSHGSPYWYDRWVPMVFLGAGVTAGESNAPAETVDFAPTLARLGGVAVPDDLDGQVLYLNR